MRLREVFRKLETRHPEGMSGAELQVANEDLLPTAPEKRTWDWSSFVSFWIADGFNLNTFTMSATLLTQGLTWWQAFICVVVGYTLVGPFVVLNARPGAVFHIKFPAVARTSFGIFGSYWPIINRTGMACIWSGVQAWLGGECVHVFLRALWPSIDNIHNIMSPASQTTSAYILCFVMYWILMLPTIWVPLHKLHYLFKIKSIVAPAVGFALFGWSIQRGGTGAVFSRPSTMSGSTLAWTMLRGIAVAFNNLFPLIINSPDFASPAKTPRAAIWPQLITLPVVFAVTSLMGIVIGASAEVQFGEQMWDIVQIMDRMLDDMHASTRAGLAFISLGFVYVQLLTNVAANSVSAGCDLTALCPRYVNIRRGGYFSALVAIVMCPWLLYTSSSSFTQYLSGFSVFLACIAGPMMADYWLIRRGHFRIADLYSLQPSGWYWYTWGINWRAYVAYFVGFGINLPGFINFINSSIYVSNGWKHVFDLAWITGTGSSACTYVLCCWLFPPPGMYRRFEEVDESDFLATFQGAYNFGHDGEAYEGWMQRDGPPESEADKGISIEKPVVSNETFVYD